MYCHIQYLRIHIYQICTVCSTCCVVRYTYLCKYSFCDSIVSVHNFLKVLYCIKHIVTCYVQILNVVQQPQWYT